MMQSGPDAGGKVANIAPLTPVLTHHLLGRGAGGAALNASG